MSRPAEEARMEVARLATEAATLLGLDWTFNSQDATVHGGFIGEGYGIPVLEAADAIRLVGRTEGLVLDPTYTGKAMAGLLDGLRRGRLGSYRTVLFVHTGGQPAFFAGDGDWLR